MKKNTIIIVVVVIVLVLGVYFISKKSNYSASGTGQNTASSQLFASSPFAQYAYLISSSEPFDANTQLALTGFSVTKNNLPDGSVQIILNAVNPEYKTQTFVVKTGEKLYFIEKNLKDDANNEEKFLGDDTAVLVNADGYIVEQK
ncbi:MAG: hypothetical protein WC847_00955 [Candidatus Paceibacterota bacterium]|jgi:hypothetical protein